MAAATVLVVGEALVDLAPAAPAATGPHPGRAEPIPMVAYPGGSPANVAVGLARLEVTTAFAGRLSAAGFGPWLRRHLAGNGVDVDRSITAEENCSLAVVALDDTGAATYTFYVEGTADWQWQPRELPDAGSLDVAAVHTGSLATALAPGRATLTEWLAAVHRAGRVLVSFDPNVRPTLIDDLDHYRQSVAALVSRAHLIKVSEEDLAVLYPGDQPLEVAKRWAETGPELVVVTHGAAGASAVRADGTTVRRTPPAVDVLDTVGAGDAFTAGLLAHLAQGPAGDRAASARGALHPGGPAGLDDDQVADALDFANRVAAVTCARAGADPPNRSEVGHPPAARPGGLGQSS